MTTIKFNELTIGQEFRFKSDVDSTVRTCQQIGPMEIYCPPYNGMGGKSEVYFKDDKEVFLYQPRATKIMKLKMQYLDKALKAEQEVDKFTKKINQLRNVSENEKNENMISKLLATASPDYTKHACYTQIIEDLKDLL